MKIKKLGLVAVALASASALALSGCASDAGSGEGSTGSTTAVVTTNGSEPQNPLLPANTTETGGGKIVTSIFAGLVSYTATGDIENEVAKSIESDDATNWTVKLNDGWKFTNGEAVDAASFVDAWNYAALLSNAQGASYFFDNIAGYGDLQVTVDDPSGAKNEDGSAAQVPAPTAETMSGLKIVDDLTFTVELAAAEADWPLRLGYSAYMPLPKAGLEDMEAFGQNPIGNGPYMLADENAWVHEEKIDLVTNPDYKGVRTPANGGLQIIFYPTLEAAYADAQGGNLDVLDGVPDSAFETYTSDFPDRNVNQPAAIFQAFNIPDYIAHFGMDEEGELRRHAISMAINRDEITEVIFQGTRTPATDYTSPVINGWTDKLKGADVLAYNPEEAKKVWAQADAIAPFTGEFTIAYNSDGGHQAWVDAVTNSVANTLGITAAGKPYPTFAAMLDDRKNQALTGGVRAGWQGDYPSMYNFLAPLYQTGAGSNYEGYTNPEFDALLKEGSNASSIDEATAKYQAAQEVLLKDLATVPLWYSNVVGVWSDKVDNVVFGWDSVPLYSQITKK